MNRRTLLAVALFAPLGARLARSADAAPAHDQADVARVAAYLNGIHTLKARFLQTAANGDTTRGIAWLERPGRMRFQYDPPSPLLLVANHGKVIFHDSQLEQTSTIPMEKTPLGILLAPDVDLTGSVTVVSIQRLPGQLQLTLARTASPAEGQLTLTLADAPLLLRSWVVTDAQHNETHVSLFNVDLGGSFEPSLFEFTDPNLQPARRG